MIKMKNEKKTSTFSSLFLFLFNLSIFYFKLYSFSSIVGHNMTAKVSEFLLDTISFVISFVIFWIQSVLLLCFFILANFKISMKHF